MAKKVMAAMMNTVRIASNTRLTHISEHPDESLPKARRKALRAAEFSSFPRGAKTKPHGLDRAAALYIGRFEGSMQK